MAQLPVFDAQTLISELRVVLSDKVDAPVPHTWILELEQRLSAHLLTNSQIERLIDGSVMMLKHVNFEELSTSPVAHQLGRAELRTLTFSRRVLITARDVLIICSAKERLWDDWFGVWLTCHHLGEVIDSKGTSADAWFGMADNVEVATRQAQQSVDIAAPAQAMERIRAILRSAWEIEANSDYSSFHFARKELRRIVSLYTMLSILFPDPELSILVRKGIALNRRLGSRKDEIMGLPFSPTDF
ncbi:hypothetical protein [Rathayibacter sp. AY1C7]|uniref:hypothetical protein n=1 Tax=Rathayibacter sp. AY1C7 TaxID=2080540 RepID=UPI0011B03CA1|nr:hypothetical protein [Rathayibacter sp. AY1C7]